MKVVIVGGVAGGATAAARIRRLDEQAENLNRLLSESRPWFRVLTKLMRRK